MLTFTTTLTRTFWMVLGFIFVAIGIIGYITPMMPGLVFFLMATYCFAKGSRKFLRLLISNKYVGQQIIDFKRGKGMTMKTKIIAIITMLVSMFISAFFMVKIYWVKWAICITAMLVVVIIWKQKTKVES
ncbi:MAG: YbaN family protein [Bacteroidetes bacterium]|nr:YbaN family protein [Bacteroidota bacterium]MBK7968773.1 YbaN family protein [Bacteroidota bacterium]MBK9045543.1 YbaN family protein [Bacteroidota bacterium]MBL0072694.1 YbaN family protein [Bacteroidota bacterium]